jgi:hypothetical protein
MVDVSPERLRGAHCPTIVVGIHSIGDLATAFQWCLNSGMIRAFVGYGEVEAIITARSAAIDEVRDLEGVLLRGL